MAKYAKMWHALELEVNAQLLELDMAIEEIETKAKEVQGRCENCHDYWLSSAKELRIRRDAILRTRNEMLNLIEGQA